jgi:hypothetical protein
MTPVSSANPSIVALRGGAANETSALRSLRDGAASKGAVDVEKLRTQVGEFVGNAFYGTLLKEMHEGGFKSKYFDGGRGEDVFQGQLNQEYVRKIARAGKDPVATQLFESFKRALRIQDDGAASVDATREIATA